MYIYVYICRSIQIQNLGLYQNNEEANGEKQAIGIAICKLGACSFSWGYGSKKVWVATT